MFTETDCIYIYIRRLESCGLSTTPDSGWFRVEYIELVASVVSFSAQCRVQKFRKRRGWEGLDYNVSSKSSFIENANNERARFVLKKATCRKKS